MQWPCIGLLKSQTTSWSTVSAWNFFVSKDLTVSETFRPPVGRTPPRTVRAFELDTEAPYVFHSWYMSRAKSRPASPASVSTERARSRHGHPGKALTALLVLIASALAVTLWLVLRQSKPPPAVSSGHAPLERSSKIVFDKTTLDDHLSAVRVANVQVVDFDRDGLNDILVCDTARNAVILYRQIPGGRFEERILADNLKCPAHATVVDLDKDGDLDVVVAVLGSIFPWDELVGRVVLLENEGDHFTQHVLLDDVRRVADVEALFHVCPATATKKERRE